MYFKHELLTHRQVTKGLQCMHTSAILKSEDKKRKEGKKGEEKNCQWNVECYKRQPKTVRN